MTNSENKVISVTDINPDRNPISVITQPFHIAKILNSDSPIIFE